MAEIAIPMILLGGMYVLSNKDNKESKDNKECKNKPIQKEGFQANRNLPASRQKQILQHANTHQDFPVSGNRGLSELKSTPNYYSSENAPVDKYYQETAFVNENSQDVNSYKSLTGNNVTKDDLKHNNMVPFFGSKVKQNMNLTSHEGVLDNLNGGGSQFIKKQEIAPLFKPEENMQWAFGTPNTSDFIQSRINPSLKMSNIKPFKEIRVGPGLDKKDGVLGSGGFNSGMEARERWMSKTVDELRTKCNPKLSYGGVMLGGKRTVQNIGVMGKMEKHLPDTYYINTPERYFTTTGLEKGQTVRSDMIMPEENRESTTTSYYGNGAHLIKKPYDNNSKYHAPHRPQLDADIKHISNITAPNKRVSENEYGKDGYVNSVLPNNRSITSNQGSEFGIVGNVARAVVAPLLDVLRPSRKENVVGNLRLHGNAGNGEINSGYVYNPANRLKTTIREMTENRPDHMFVGNQTEAGGYGYTMNEHKVIKQNRDTTNTHYVGNSGNTNGTSNMMTYDAAYNAQTVDKEPTLRSREPMGSSVKMFNGKCHTNIKFDKLESDRLNNRQFVPQQLSKSNFSKQQYGQIRSRSEYGQNIQMERNTSDTLDAFNSNPYTKPLNSVA